MKNKKIPILDKYKNFSMPVDDNAEKAAIWYCLNGKYEIVIEFIKNKDLFFNSDYSNIFEQILNCINKETEPTPLNILRAGFKDLGKLASEIKNLQPPTNDIYGSCMRVIETDISRKVIIKCSESMDLVYANNSDSISVADDLTNFSNEISESLNHMSKIDFQDLIKEVVQEVKERVLDNSKVVKTNIGNIDDALGGFEDGSLSVIGARPSMGKTAFLVQLMYNIAVIQQKPVLMFNLEMTKQELTKRILALHTRFSNFEIRQGFDRDMDKFNEFEQRIKTLTANNIHIIDNMYDGNQIVSKTKQMVKNSGVRVMFFDYLQLSSIKDSGNREQEVAKISKSLKQLAKFSKIPVVALSQLNRLVESRGGDCKPKLSDIRESGSVEQDADNVIFLHRPEYFGIESVDYATTTVNLLELIIAKARNGVLKTVLLDYDRKYNLIRNWGLVDENLPTKIVSNANNINSFEKEVPKQIKADF